MPSQSGRFEDNAVTASPVQFRSRDNLGFHVKTGGWVSANHGQSIARTELQTQRQRPKNDGNDQAGNQQRSQPGSARKQAVASPGGHDRASFPCSAWRFRVAISRATRHFKVAFPHADGRERATPVPTGL